MGQGFDRQSQESVYAYPCIGIRESHPKEEYDDIVFLIKLVRGGTSRSFGIWYEYFY